ncbi:DUF124-domain-containing protein [Microthyrium microscopicum]|uniref:Altered inheritance of mitochondria protein 24, mitochondrial n=1 Tax=Microthyrium microscopicum TaxID=703497 RepID=A0A6A6US45_9PEZI|nr:DUF124-domain-containing protein [Microthyrium microscopicum]
MSAPNYPPPPSQNFYPPPPDGQAAQAHYPPPPSQAPATQYSPPPPAKDNQYPPPQQHFAPPPQQTIAQPPPQSTTPNPAPVAAAAPPDSFNANVASNMPGGAPSAAHFTSQAHVDDVGSFNGGAYRISHRDTNSVLTVQLAIGCPLHAKPGSMVAMSPTITLKGEIKFSMKKFITGSHMSMSTFTGPGELLLAPAMLGDVSSIRLSGSEVWNVGKDSFLAATDRVQKDLKAQSISKAMFSGEGLFNYRVSGTGILFISSFGAIIRKDLGEKEQYIIDNGHLVAWNCQYVIERVASGGILSNVAAGEGLVCKFTGPGSVFLQTRNQLAMAATLQGVKVN